MQASTRTIWFCVIVGLVGLAIVPTNLGFAILWCCLWFGSAIFFVGARRRFPGFVKLAPPASLKDLGIPDEALAGALSNPWYVLLWTTTAWLCVMAVPLMVPESSLIGFGVGIAITLLGAAAWLGTRQSGSAKIARALLGATSADQRRVIGIVRNHEAALLRDTFWFDIAGVHHGTAEVESVHGGTVTVATATPTSNTYGYRQEDREDLELNVDGETVTVETRTASWAAPARPLASAPKLRERAPGGWSMGSAYIRGSRVWEREEIGRGQRVVALGRWDPATRRLGGERVIVFGLGGDRDPIAALRRELWARRWPIAALIGLSVLAVVVSIELSPSTEAARLTAQPHVD